MPTLETRKFDNVIELPVANRSNGISLIKGSRILIAEDCEDTSDVIGRIVGGAGAKVDFARDGMEAITKSIVNPYDLILMDIHMPGVDGYEAIQKMRVCGFSGPVIAITAHEIEEEREKCLLLGFDDYLTKPINRVNLLFAIADRLKRRDSKDEPAAH